MPNIILNEEAQSQVQEVLNDLPISALPKVQKLIAIFNANIEKVPQQSDPIPPVGGGGGGGSARPPKP